jgi:threonine/homoserine/homoserine lactone efflux protein
MASTELLIGFLITSALFACLPGPAMLYAAAHVMSGGRKAGLKAVAGIHLGAYGHIIATSAGLTLLLQTVPLLYSGLKIGGACYLMWLGFRMLTAGSNSSKLHISSRPRSGALSQSILVELLNPKTALFFLAYLPQFVDPQASLPIWLQLALLGFVVNALFTIADLLVVLGASQITKQLAGSNRLTGLTQRIGGLVLIGMDADLMLRKQA